MSGHSRRTFLKLMGSGVALGALPGSIQRALAIPANNRTGSIRDIEHIIILTQENRSFDHYFGSLRGVRGFADPRAVKLPSGQSVWHQPNGSGELLPFRPDLDKLGMAYLHDVPHGWNDSHGAWNNGHYDQWVPNKGTNTMTCYNRNDMPYHYALADAFTICDAYYSSVMGPTDPNRYHLWSGWTGNDGSGGGPVISNAEVGYSWTTFPERLQQAGVRWKLYQDIGNGLDQAGYWGWTSDPFIGNYGDNSLLYFTQYQNAQPGEPLADFAKTGTNVLAYGRDPFHLMDNIRADVQNGTLPQVAWITTPEAFTEHPNFPPNMGAWYISQLLDILTENPEIWSKTALFINYDEGGGFFDHLVPPTPPQTATQGASTVDASSEIYPGDAKNIRAPYGLGTRVPMIVVSPWSKGGWVNSQVFDHTSLLRFIEARFGHDYPGLQEPNITPWRRAVTGDLTSTFDFVRPNDLPASLPDTSAYLPAELSRQPSVTPVPPTNQTLPEQERGIRPARALPYSLYTRSSVDSENNSVRLHFGNAGKAAAVFHVRTDDGVVPRDYSVEPYRELDGEWQVSGQYAISVYGPNGFFRSLQGVIDGTRTTSLDVHSRDALMANGIRLIIRNTSVTTREVRIRDQYTGRTVEVTLKPGDSISRHWSTARSHGWYDLRLSVEDDADFACRLAGHVENGRPSVSDPAMGGVAVKGLEEEHREKASA